MNERKLHNLLKAAGFNKPPEAPFDFEAQVMRQIHHEPSRQPMSLTDQLGFLFPRVAATALVLILLCLAADYIAGGLSSTDLAESAAQLSNQWLLSGEDI
jgi:hypothetical protein